MPTLAFEMTTSNQEFRRFEFRGKNNIDYYDGDLESLSPQVEMKIEKSLAGEFGIYKLTSHNRLAFRRSWSHIRNDKTNLTIFWFVRRGTIMVSKSGCRFEINPHECAITRSLEAFYMELTPDRDGCFDAIHVVMPTHKVYSLINDAIDIGRSFQASIGELAMIERILTVLFEEDDQTDQDMAEQIVETLLAGIGKKISRIAGDPAPRQSIADQRVADIKRYINQNFANPDINAKIVADGCGISLRYLCHILRKSDLSFSGLLWDRRLSTAYGWLRDPNMHYRAISELAYLAGFKSSAHFSRMFKMRYQIAPREFRYLNATGQSPGIAPLVSEDDPAQAAFDADIQPLLSHS